MAKTPVGTRITALSHITNTHAYVLGHGVYAGDEVPPLEPFKSLGMPNPKLVMDNGDVHWGCECWWGPYDVIHAKMTGREIVQVPSGTERVEGE